MTTEANETPANRLPETLWCPDCQHQNAAADVPEIALTKGVKYGITVRSNAFYRITKPGNAKFNFPKTIGNIRIESFVEDTNNTSLATFPATTNDTRVTPCVNVIFIAD